MQFIKRAVKEKLRNAVAEPPPLDFTNIRKISETSPLEAMLACRGACLATYLGDDTVLCRVLMKYLFHADARDIGLTPHLCLNGYWEIWITQAFARTIQTGWNCVDIGANQGYFSVLMADLAGADGRVMAVEPNPKMIKFLRKNLEVNGYLPYATVMNKAVSSANGEQLRLVIPEGRALNATIVNAANEGDEFFEVETATLDELTKDWARVDFVKIDAEGAEEEIWRGMSETLRQNPNITIVMEFKCSRYPNPRVFLEKIIADGFPLRHICYDSTVEDLALERALTERFDEDWMLLLQRS